jgi:hypothetical protein
MGKGVFGRLFLLKLKSGCVTPKSDDPQTEAQMTTEQTEKKTHTGGCHCGAVRYEFDGAIGEVIACNCSICGKSGTLLAFVPATDFRLLSGADQLVEYKFNKHVINHNFCKVCGIKSFAAGKPPTGPEMRAINVRCLDDVDVAALKVKHVDGKSV